MSAKCGACAICVRCDAAATTAAARPTDVGVRMASNKMDACPAEFEISPSRSQMAPTCRDTHTHTQSSATSVRKYPAMLRQAARRRPGQEYV